MLDLKLNHINKPDSRMKLIRGLKLLIEINQINMDK